MGTRKFNWIDLIIAKLRIRHVERYIESGDTVLDFGCGHQAALLTQIKYKIKFGIGVDYEVDNKKNDNIQTINYKFVNKLPFKNDFFDKIFLLAVIEHIEVKKAKRLLKELSRILKPKGKIIFTTPTPASKPILELLANKLCLISKEEINDHKKYYNREDILTCIRPLPLKLIEYKLFQLGLNSVIVLEKNK